MGEGDVASGPVTAISANGEYVFFDTPEKLVPQASNQNPPPPTLDTYEWHDGRISLIGEPKDPSPTFFLGYSPYEYTSSKGERVKVEGGNVFIGTHAKLSTQDTNALGNVYDARICEPESPCIQPPAGESAVCLGGSCQAPPPLPAFQSPATLTLSSSGNIATEPPPPTVKKVTKKTVKCKKGETKNKKGQCVKRKKSKKAKKSAHTNRRAGQ